jgi:uncharacterized protein (TIGR02246 family)
MAQLQQRRQIMKMWLKQFLFVLLVGLVAGQMVACSNSSGDSAGTDQMTTDVPSAIENEIREQTEAFLASLRALDGDRILDHFDQNELVFIVNTLEYSYEEVKTELVEGFFGSLETYEASWRETQVVALGNDAALFHGITDVHQTFRTGESRSVSGVHFTGLYQRRDGEWKITFSHQSYTEPETGMADQDRAADEAAIRAVVAAYETAVNQRDAAAVAGLYTRDADLIIYDGPRLAGREAIRQTLESNYTTLTPTWKINISVNSIRFLAPDKAIVETVATFNEGSIRKDRGTAVMVREGDRWLYAALRVYAAEAHSENDIQVIREFRSSVLDAIEREDWFTVANAYVEDGIAMPPGEHPVRGRAAILEWHEQLGELIRVVGRNSESVEISVQGDLGYLYGTYETSYVMAGTEETITEAGKHILIVRRQPDGGWKTELAIWNSSGQTR